RRPGPLALFGTRACRTSPTGVLLRALTEDLADRRRSLFGEPALHLSVPAEVRPEIPHAGEPDARTRETLPAVQNDPLTADVVVRPPLGRTRQQGELVLLTVDLDRESLPGDVGSLRQRGELLVGPAQPDLVDHLCPGLHRATGHDFELGVVVASVSQAPARELSGVVDQSVEISQSTPCRLQPVQRNVGGRESFRVFGAAPLVVIGRNG